MAADFEGAFAILTSTWEVYETFIREVRHAHRIHVGHEIPISFPQHKGQPMYFGSVRLEKAYVNFHLTPLYMNAALTKSISSALKKRMQGKTCFNFKTELELELHTDWKRLTEVGFKLWGEKKWL